MKEPRLSEKAKEVSERLWSAYYSEHGSDKTVAAEPELSKTEKRKARQARADALAEEKQKKKKKREPGGRQNGGAAAAGTTGATSCGRW